MDPLGARFDLSANGDLVYKRFDFWLSHSIL
jgi:hypothetical protein